ncbi:MAG: DUF1905 domain-containing protein [Kineosporiaceae bacterium]
MGDLSFEFTAQLWPWDARVDSWVFVTVPEDVSDEIADVADAGPRRGFGAVKVRVSVGATTWTTSIFPSKEQAAYVLPVKKAVRTARGLAVGDTVTIALEVLVGELG